MRFLGVFLAIMTGLAVAPGIGHADHNPSHDEVLEAVRRGEIKPLAEIEAAVKGKLPGLVIKVELQVKHGAWIYEFKTLDNTGHRTDVYVDAKTGAVLKTERK